MPSKDAHVQAAIENGKTLDYLRERIDEFPQWVVTVAFYQALHVVEAVLAADPRVPQPHTDSHTVRGHLLKKENRYAKIWKHYRELFNDSLIARYLRENDGAPTHAIFADYISPEEVERVHVRHNLVQIIKSARKLLGDPEFLRELDSQT